MFTDYRGAGQRGFVKRPGTVGLAIGIGEAGIGAGVFSIVVDAWYNGLPSFLLRAGGDSVLAAGAIASIAVGAVCAVGIRRGVNDMRTGIDLLRK